MRTHVCGTPIATTPSWHFETFVKRRHLSFLDLDVGGRKRIVFFVAHVSVRAEIPRALLSRSSVCRFVGDVSFIVSETSDLTWDGGRVVL